MKHNIIFIFLFVTSITSAQSSRRVVERHMLWSGIFSEYKSSPAWSATLDVQARYEYTDGDMYQWGVRAGISYKLKSGNIFSAGIARFSLYPNPNGKPARPEWRPWEEIGRKIISGHHTFYPRFRFEQRFIREYEGDDLEQNFSFNTLRERLRFDYAYRFNPGKQDGFSLLEGQEFLVNTKTNSFTSFDAFRIWGGLGYAINKIFSLQLTYLYIIQQKDSLHFEEQNNVRFTLQMQFSKPVRKTAEESGK